MTRPKPVPVEERTEQGPGREHETIRTHPAFGMIQASRVGGNAFLFGSPIHHRHFVEISIYDNAQERVYLHRKWHSAPIKPIVTLKLSSVQWAEFLTTMNMGQGVPCTLEYVNGEERPPVLDETNTQQKLEQDIARTAKQNTKELNEIADMLDKLAKRGSVKRSELEELNTLFTRVVKNAPDNAAFLAKSMKENVEEMVTTAKAEVTAFVHAATRGQPGLENFAPDAPALENKSKPTK